MYRGGGTGTEGCVFVWCLSEDTSVVSGETRLESEDEFPGTVFIRITTRTGIFLSKLLWLCWQMLAPRSPCRTREAVGSLQPRPGSCGKSPAPPGCGKSRAAPGKLREVSNPTREAEGSLQPHPGSCGKSPAAPGKLREVSMHPCLRWLCWQILPEPPQSLHLLLWRLCSARA